jgi:hypothetical protein
MRSLEVFFALLFFFIGFIGGCAPDAPHDNPIDPGSPDYKNDGTITGTVLSIGLPYVGIANALVVVEESGAAQFTDGNGKFSFANVPSGNITLIVSKAAYADDTVRINLPVGGKVDTTLHIDALPQVSNTVVVTSKIDEWWPGPVYSALVSAVVVDSDGLGDIDTGSVFVRVGTDTFKMHSIDGKNWQVNISASQLPNQNLQWLVGKPFIVSATDHEKGTGLSAEFYITRIIEAEAVPTSPTNSSVTSSHPLFNWDPPPITFSYGYQLNIYQINSGSQTLIGSPIAVNSDSVSYFYPDSLPNGQYGWTITVKDDFGNSSTSKEASFQVQ